MSKKLIISLLVFSILVVGLATYVRVISNKQITHATFAEDYRPHPTPYPDLNSKKLFSLIQSWRQSQGLPLYDKDPRLCAMADTRLQDIQTDFSHTLFIKRYSSLTYRVSENISENYPTEQLTLNAWLNSPVHLADLERPDHFSCLACKNDKCVQIFSSFSSN